MQIQELDDALSKGAKIRRNCWISGVYLEEDVSQWGEVGIYVVDDDSKGYWNPRQDDVFADDWEEYKPIIAAPL